MPAHTNRLDHPDHDDNAPASANAPAFFAGMEDPHAHTASLSGIKTQALSSSRDGQGGFNQLVFDDTPGQPRIELGSTQFDTWLQLGHHKQQQDNARLADRGHGAELATQGAASLRAGNGLLISADARRGATGDHLDSREAIEQVRAGHDLTTALADVAGKQNAALTGDPAAKDLPVSRGLHHAREVMEGTDAHGEAASSSGEFKATGGGDGTVAAWTEPRIQYSAPAGITQATPMDAVLVSGKGTVITSGQDTNLVSQGNQAISIRDGLSLFTIGKASNGQKPNQETGIHLHAASGKVSLQSQTDKTTAAAAKQVTLASTHASTTASAKGHVLATAQGAYLKIEGGDIQLHAPGQVVFKAAQKNWTGPANTAGVGLKFPQPPSLYDEQFRVLDKQTGEPRAFVPYRIEGPGGQILATGLTGEDGRTVRLQTGLRQSDLSLVLED